MFRRRQHGDNIKQFWKLVNHAALQGGPSPHRWNQIRKLPLTPGIQTLGQYDQATMFGALDAMAYLQGIDPLRALAVADIQQVHRQIFKSVHPWAGEFRGTGQMATVAGFPAADSRRINRELELALFQTREMLEFALAIRDPYRTIAALGFLHVRYERVHPFLDGNGRSGRALLAAQFEKVFGTLPAFADQAGYRKAIHASANRDLAPLVNYLGASAGLASVTGIWRPPFQICPRFLEESDGDPSFAEDLAWTQITE